MSHRPYPNAARARKRITPAVTSRIVISPDAEFQTVTIRPWTRAERLHWYQTGRILHHTKWSDSATIDTHPELRSLNGSWDNLYGDGFEG